MFYLESNVAIEIEKAALKSLEQYGQSWRALDKIQLQKKQLEYLEQLSQFAGPSTKAIPATGIIEGEYGNEFMQICVKLSVVHLLLVKQPDFQYWSPKKSRT